MVKSQKSIKVLLSGFGRIVNIEIGRDQILPDSYIFRESPVAERALLQNISVIIS